MLSSRSLLVILLLLIGNLSIAQEEGKKIFKIFIDPGHGGKDTGKLAKQDGMKDEKHLNLIIATKLGNYITEKIDNTKVIYSRTTDKTISLDEIVDLANESNADFFISIHCNSNPNTSIYGTRTHIHGHKFGVSRNLALTIEKEFKTRAGRNSLGIMDAQDRGTNLQVLQYTKMPGVLVECGFISNLAEEKFLNSDLGQDYIASAIYRACKTVINDSGIKSENRDTIYKVQILSSTAPVNFKEKRFRKLDIRVEEFYYKDKTYAYQYLAGREYEYALAEKLMNKLRKEGFKDAFIVKLKDGEYKVNRTSR